MLLIVALLSGCAKEAPVEPEPVAPVVTEPVVTEPEVIEEPAEPEPADHEVQILAKAFEPEELEINAGDSVVWTNMDTRRQSIFSKPAGTFKSPVLKEGEIFEHVFEEAGELEAMSIFGFTGKITVK